MARWVMWNENPAQKSIGDCAVRAVALALALDWNTAYSLIAAKGFQMKDMPSSNAVFGAVLREHGFSRHAVPNSCPDCFTVGDFADENQKGVYVVGTGSHVVTIKDGIVYDSWNSLNEIPQYYWYKGEK